jgi:hypothetical protein
MIVTDKDVKPKLPVYSYYQFCHCVGEWQSDSLSVCQNGSIIGRSGNDFV